jgi:hypothetical protein
MYVELWWQVTQIAIYSTISISPYNPEAAHCPLRERAACYFIPRGRGMFSLLSLFFFPCCFLLWVFSALLFLSDAFSFFFGLSARFMLLGSLLRGFIFC